MSHRSAGQSHWIAVRGSRYRAVLGLVAADSLDPLALFFLKHVLRKEKRIDHLTTAFGLPSRVVEDILADLLKQGQITLNLAANAIGLRDVPARGRLRRPGPEISVWQDDFSGAILPINLVRRFRERRDHAIRFRDDRQSQHPGGFLDLPDAQILALLRPLAPEIRSTSDGWLADCLLEREYVEPVELFFPLVSASIDKNQISYVDSPDVPSWLIKAWSREMASDNGMNPETVDEAVDRSLMLMSTQSVNDRHSLRLFDVCGIQYYSRKWHDSVLKLLSTAADPALLRSALHRLDISLRDLNAQLKVSGHVEVRSTTSTSHIRELWDHASLVLAIVSDEWSTPLLSSVAAETVGMRDRDIHVVLVDAGERTRKQLPLLHPLFERTRVGEIKTAVLQKPVTGTFCMIDGRVARVGSLKSLLSTRPVLEIVGVAGIEALTARVPLFLDEHSGGWWILSQLAPSDISHKAEGPRRSSVQDIQDATSTFSETARNRIEGVENWKSVAGAEKDIEIEFASTLEERWPDLSVSADQILEKLSLLDVQNPISIGSPFETLSQACEWISTHPRQHDLDLFIPGFPAECEISLVQTFERLILSGTRIRLFLTHPASNKSVERLREFMAKLLENPLFVWSRSSSELPTMLIIDGSVIAVSSGNWLSRGENHGYGFVFQSPQFSQQVHNLIASSIGDEP